MWTCGRCGNSFDDLFCTGCGGPGHHGTCADDELGLGNVCGECWAILSHVEGVIGCASGCDCEVVHRDALRVAVQEG